MNKENSFLISLSFQRRKYFHREPFLPSFGIIFIFVSTLPLFIQNILSKSHQQSISPPFNCETADLFTKFFFSFLFPMTQIFIGPNFLFVIYLASFNCDLTHLQRRERERLYLHQVDQSHESSLNTTGLTRVRTFAVERSLDTS